MKAVKLTSKSGSLIHSIKETHSEMEIYCKEDDMQVSDGYHTMDELYDHRLALNVALFNYIARNDPSGGPTGVMKSKLHWDGTMFPGYFIVMMISRNGQISYHYKLEYWDLFKIPTVERTPTYDGHVDKEVIERLLQI